ncbi:MAG: hypothetical protein DDT25_00132 [Chloroflexi bacterium]|nr:hypothetical protein [Chloroflexota bacterium]
MAMEPDNDQETNLVSQEDDFEVVIEDDTPPEDRGRQPLPKEIVEELDNDELDKYDDAVKQRIKQYKKAFHDERREKERALREQQEALSVVKRVYEENKNLRQTLTSGEEHLLTSYRGTAELEVEKAKRAYKEAFDSGDSDKLADAQEILTSATYRLEQLKQYKPALQPQQNELQETQQTQDIPRPDQKALAWQERNSWYGSDPEMTAAALGLHQKLAKDNGVPYIGTDEYWGRIDKTMRQRFPEYFEPEERKQSRQTRSESRAPAVVAPASRSTASKRIVLNQSQLSIAKRLGLTPEQYAREVVKMAGN